MAEQNSAERMPGPPPGLWIIDGATVYGPVVYDFEERRQECVDALAPMLASDPVKVLEDSVDGLENGPAHFCRPMRGENRVKAIVKIN